MISCRADKLHRTSKHMRHLGGLIPLLLLALLSRPLMASEPLPFYPNWGGNFTLQGPHDIPLQLSDFGGKVVLLSFGYTHCPDICPTTMLIMKQVIEQLGDDAEQVQVLFITLDPERDHADRLAAYTGYFNPNFIALTGSVDDIRQVADRYGMRFEKEQFDDAGNYSVAHSNVIYLLDQQGRIRVFFKLSAPAQEIADHVRQLQQEQQSRQ